MRNSATPTADGKVSGHSLFAPSSAHRWIPCPGSMTFPENQAEGGSSTFADDGTASHEWASLCLKTDLDADTFLAARMTINGAEYVMDETRASFIQVYLDDVRCRAIGGHLFVEQKVDLSDILGEGQGGTVDAAIYLPASKTLIVEDLKYGTGEKVYASTDGGINPQLGLYALGLLKDFALFDDVENVLAVICQPRLGHIDGFPISVADLQKFGAKTAIAAEQAGAAMANSIGGNAYLNPGEKQCRWCRAKTQCPALARYVADQVRCDFETIQSDPAPVAPRDTAKLATAYLAVPLIEDWCRAVRAELSALVQGGTQVIGPDGKPYKFVEGKEGSRAWSDPAQAEAALLGQLPPDKVYAPQKVITAPVAAKLLDKKATKQLWKDIFEPLIKKPPGKPVLAVGSDPRPPFTGSATADDFNHEEELLS